MNYDHPPQDDASDDQRKMLEALRESYGRLRAREQELENLLDPTSEQLLIDGSYGMLNIHLGMAPKRVFVHHGFKLALERDVKKQSISLEISSENHLPLWHRKDGVVVDVRFEASNGLPGVMASYHVAGKDDDPPFEVHQVIDPDMLEAADTEDEVRLALKSYGQNIAILPVARLVEE
jgi:hypothetical protein